MVISLFPWEIVMLEHYYFRPETVDRIRASWIAPAIEQYVTWLTEAHYTARSVLHRVPVLMSFGEYAMAHGAMDFAQLSDHVEPFVQTWICRHGRGRSAARRSKFSHEVRNPICQMLRLVVDGYDGPGRPHKPDNPFEREAPHFMAFLVEEKGLRPRTLIQYRFHLHQFAIYLERNGIRLGAVSPTVISGFIAEYGPRVAWTTLRNACGTLRVLLRYLYREGVVSRDLSPLVEFPQSYRHAGIPRSISWDQVEQVLASIDRRSPCGRRDYAMLLLLSTYGLRACEVASLTLDDIDWRNERFRIRDRKAGNTTTYPLSAVAGSAIVDYLKNGRPATTHREVFMRMSAPLAPIGHAAVVCRAAHFIRKAGISVPRAGSHVLRHSCVQHLLNAHFSLKHIGDYVGHRSISSTQIYGKLAIEQLRDVAQGDGKDVL
ncbi:site-specific integrase [Paraburkholderia terricola]|uniref:Site-specific recombinase XerD n=1 Tax=Paraburkholderia terricola TaxID=169427 RepID=A0ABU1M1J9_9BURK|nr:site-specific integrase [Paraburkholderia terricola]MDR6412881.1 site-specific recombinase XerD [Paraburkholderia terricola]MDR6484760.1 site-specific recombinase XerD [Paraburkholderia terricola]